MLLSLLATAVLMGLAGTPHCVAMCGAPCAALNRSPAQLLAWQATRVLGYAAVGAAAAASLHGVGLLAQAAPVLRPLWTLLHLAALLLGLWLLWQGRQPGWLERLGRDGKRPGAQQAMRWPGQPMARSLLAGLVWPAWPCGLLQAALVVAALANSAAGGALVMTGFALASGMGLLAAPALWWRWGAAGRSGHALVAAGSSWAVRLSGLMLAAASAWALGHGLWQRVAAWCVV